MINSPSAPRAQSFPSTIILEHALGLARKGIAVFPCKADKSPLTRNGFKDATTDENQIRRWWGPGWSNGALIGTPTGLTFDVLDVDLQHGEAKAWMSGTPVPKTRTHGTRSGGLHLLFRPTEGLRNSASRLAKHVDIRAKGGYVIWWPAQGLAVISPRTLAAMPKWILEPALKEPPPPRIEPRDYFQRYADRAFIEARIDGLAATVATAPVGQRNSTLHWAACRFAQLVDDGLVEEGKEWACL